MRDLHGLFTTITRGIKALFDDGFGCLSAILSIQLGCLTLPQEINYKIALKGNAVIYLIGYLQQACLPSTDEKKLQ